MDTTEKLNAVIGYIEDNIAGDIDSGELARIACASVYDAGRMFALVAGISVSEYIRNRRMYLSGCELKYGNAGITETALKYGYDSPGSFARAFRRFHGFSPAEAKKPETVLRPFPKRVFRICAEAEVIRRETLTLNGREYEASFFGELNNGSTVYGYTVWTKNAF